MAVVTSIVRTNVPIGNLEIVKATLSGATSTYVSKFGAILTCNVNVRGTNTCTKTVSGRTVTITGTSSDVVDVIITGKQ